MLLYPAGDGVEEEDLDESAQASLYALQSVVEAANAEEKLAGTGAQASDIVAVPVARQEMPGTPVDLQMVAAAPSTPVPIVDTVDLPRAPAQRRAREEESEGQAMEGVTGSGMTVAASRSRTWERDDDPASPKRWKPSGEIGAIFEGMWGFLETEIVDELGGVEDNYFYKPEVDERRRLRLAWKR